MKLGLRFLLIVSGLIPAMILLVLTILFLPGFIVEYDFSVKQTILILSMLFGLLGFHGLVLSILPMYDSKPRLKFILLAAGVIGSFMFTTIIGGKSAWVWILSVDEFDEWMIWTWPVIVSIILMFLNGRDILNRNSR